MRLKDMVSGWMTGRPETVRPDQPVLEAYAIMCSFGIRHVPVVKDDRLVGILSDRDLLKRGPLGGGDDGGQKLAKLFALPVGEIMTCDDLKTAAPMTTLQQAAYTMAETRTSALPVLDGEKLVGIITSHDLLRALSGMPKSDEVEAGAR